jgi:hypothetical protein
MVEAQVFCKGTNMLDACPFLKDMGQLKNCTCRQEPGRQDKGSAALLTNGGSRMISIRSRVLSNAVSNIANLLAKQERSLFRVCEIHLKWYMRQKIVQRQYLRLNLGKQSNVAMLMLLLLLLRLIALATSVAAATVSTASTTTSTASSSRVGVATSWLLLLLELQGLLRNTTNRTELLRLVLVGGETKLAFPGADNCIADCIKTHGGSKVDHGLSGVVNRQKLLRENEGLELISELDAVEAKALDIGLARLQSLCRMLTLRNDNLHHSMEVSIVGFSSNQICFALYRTQAFVTTLAP